MEGCICCLGCAGILNALPLAVCFVRQNTGFQYGSPDKETFKLFNQDEINI